MVTQIPLSNRRLVVEVPISFVYIIFKIPIETLLAVKIHPLPQRIFALLSVAFLKTVPFEDTLGENGVS